MKYKHFIHKKLGFTMIELLVAVTIIAILTSIGLVSFRQATMNARNSKRKAELESIRQALVLYRADEGSYPAYTGDTAFDNMMDEIADYYSAAKAEDPKNVSPYVYGYSSTNGVTFVLSTAIEPDGIPYTVTNP